MKTEVIGRGAWALALVVACVGGRMALAADPPAASKPELAIQAAAQGDKLLYLFFYRENDAATKAMYETVKSAAGEQDVATWATVRVNDPVERAVAEKYAVTRAPMPMVVAVHPNGAVTGYYHTKATVEQLAQCRVSPKKAECMQALQRNQLVLVCLQADENRSVPVGVRELLADPHFSGRTRVVTLAVHDPAEAAFVASMEVDPRSTGPLTVFIAPPGAMVGKFAPTATKDQLAAKLAEAGKCCDDEKCRHNAHQPAPQATTPGKVRP